MFARLACAFIFAAALMLPVRAAEPPVLHYWHLYADDQGVSHFKEEMLDFKVLPSAQLAKPPAVATLGTVKGASLLMLPAGQKEDWHNAPGKQFMVVVQGASEVTASDGRVKTFRAGEIVLLDDAKGKGHITKAVGAADHIALAIPVE